MKMTTRILHTSSHRAALVLRLGLGTMYLAHSIALKWLTYGLAGTAQFFASAGLPSALVYVTFAAEAIGGVLLILGIQTRLVVVSLMPALVGAIVWVHASNGWVFTSAGGGWEYPAFLIVASVTGAGFAAPVTLRTDDGTPFQLSVERGECGDQVRGTQTGLYDIDGDGQPELLNLSLLVKGNPSTGRWGVYQLQRFGSDQVDVGATISRVRSSSPLTVRNEWSGP